MLSGLGLFDSTLRQDRHPIPIPLPTCCAVGTLNLMAPKAAFNSDLEKHVHDVQDVEDVKSKSNYDQILLI